MKIERMKLGIVFNFSSKWMGGVIYVINIVRTLDYLEDSEKPEIYLFYNPELERFLAEFKYPYLVTVPWIFPSIVKGNLNSILRRRNLFIGDILDKYQLDALYPLPDFPVRTKTNVKLVSWWADLQEKHYPEFFSRFQILGRDIRARNILQNCDHLVLSSQDVLNDFSRFFKLRKGLKTHIFHFVSIIDEMDEMNIDELMNKYSLPEKYFMVSNQFHKHKNHKVLLQALIILNNLGFSAHLAFTGKFPSASESPYLAELHDIIEINILQNQVTMLGVLSRTEQLLLMKHSQAVIQPSLFEGWSTVIEDAKSLQVPVIASNLNVNIEQLGEKGTFFDPHNPEELASIIAGYPERDLSDSFYEDYAIRIKEAAKILLQIFK